MSIFIGPRAIFNAWGHCASTPMRTIVPSLLRETETPNPVEQGELTCTPWEGLYLEHAETTQRPEEVSASRHQLDPFLTSLMYGE